ncbi:Probable RNA-directed DNA polymerase from transposon X-element [Anthophora plagiata]
MLLHELNIIQINVNSIITNERRVTLLDCLNKQKPDVVLLSETKLNPRHKISFKNYNFIRRDRINSKQAGGTGILIRNDIKFKNIQPNCIKNSTCFESTVLEIKFQNNQKLYLIAAYATSSCKKEFMLELKAVFDALELNKASNYYLLAGDLNAKHYAWGNTINNARGVSLNKWFLENQITFRIDLYRTAVPSYPKSGAFIDLCLVDNRIKLRNTIGPNLLRSFRYDSDHRASVITISIPSTDYFLFDETVKEIKFNFNRTDWTTFKEYLNNHNNPIIPNNRNLKTNEIDIHIDTLNKNILHAIENTVPRIDHNTNSTDKYITPRIKNLRKQKSYIITQMNRLTNLRNYTSAHDLTIDTYKKALKAIRYEIKKAFQESVSNYWKRKVSNISLHKPKELFPSVNSIFRPKNSSDIDILKIPTTNRNLLEKANLNPQSLPIESNKFLITDTAHKLDIIGAHFESVHTQNSHMGKPQLSNIILHKIETLQQEMQLDKDNDVTVCTFSDTNTADCPDQNLIPSNFFTSFTKLEKTFKNLNNKKSASFDGIPNIVLKHLPRQYIFYYSILFNNCLNTSYFPEIWKTAKLITIKKKGKDGSDPNSYRPISLLPNISKVFETVINDSIVSFSNSRSIIPECQFGFRHKHSTVHAITKFTSDICWARNAGDCVGAVMIDLEKAFDTVWLDGLFYKLLKKEFPTYLVKILWNMLHEKKFYVAYGQHKSSKAFRIDNGLQQGTVNSPVLFNIFISDLLQLYGLNNDDCKKGIAFADDLLIYIRHNKVSKLQVHLQETFNRLQDYFHTWKLKVNINKCETILFRPYISPISDANNDVRTHASKFHIHDSNNPDNKIPRKNVVRYLGLHLDFKLNYNEHILSQIDKAQKSFLSHKRLFYSKDLDKCVKILCYKLLIRPILTYGCPIWYNISAGTMEKLRIFERKCLRACLGKYRSPESNYKKMISNYKLYEEAKLIRIDLFILKLIRNHWSCVNKVTSNSLIHCSMYPNPLYFAKAMETGYTPPESFIYLDSEGYIQNTENIPIIYHVNRKTYEKKITYNKNIKSSDPNMRFNFKLSSIDLKDKHRQNTKKYWWL